MPCAKFGGDLPGGSGKEYFLKSSIYFNYLAIISSLTKSVPSFEFTRILFIQGCYVPSLVKIGTVVLEKLSVSFCNFVIISSWKRALPFMWTNLNPLYLRMLFYSMVEIDQMVLEKKMKMWKINKQTDGPRTTGDQKSSLELLAQVS